MLNLPRLHARQALAVALGVVLAGGQGNVSAEVMEGVAGSAAQAQELAWQVNKARHLRRVREKARAGLAGVMNG